MRKVVLTLAVAGVVSSVGVAVVCLTKDGGAHAKNPLGSVPTNRMEALGVPLASRYPDSFRNGSGAYARNVWTMRAFDGRVYVGCGNSANGGPAVSCGPVPVVAYDPKKGAFVEEWSAPDEQIDVLKVFSDGALYIPGHDPTEEWDFGNVYRRRPGADAQWEKLRTLPMGLHCYDIVEFDGRLVACGYGTYESRDWGAAFDWTQDVRYYTFLRFPETLYAVATVSEAKLAEKLKVNRFQSFLWDIPGETVVARRKVGGKFERVAGARPGDVFPETPEAAEHCLKVGRVSALGRRLVYVGGIVHVDHQMAPVGAYVAEDGPEMFRARRIALPKGATPWFTQTEGGKVYLLYSVANASAKTVRNHLAVSSDGEDFHDVLCFDAPTFARAFAYLDGYMYFGLGTEIGDHGRYTGDNALTVAFSNKELSSASGTILRCPFELNQ